MMSLENELHEALGQSKVLNAEVAQKYKERIGRGKFTKDEDPVSHFCAYFLPYDPTTKQVLFGHHKKAGKWLSIPEAKQITTDAANQAALDFLTRTGL